MKRLIYTFAFFLAATSCNLEELNENPNVPLEVPLSTLLPPTQKALADVQAGQLFQISSIFSQQMQGVGGQPAGYEIYDPNELFVGNSWGDLYVEAIVNLKTLIEQAEKEGSPHYAGIARILQAQAFGLLTDTWGDVPFFESALGPDQLNPSFDEQQRIYDEIQALLSQAITDLSLESILTPSSDDIIYNGNLQNWIATANLLKARYLMHTTKRSNSAPSDALTFLNEGFTSPDQDFAYPYLGTGEDINPISSLETDELMIVDPTFTELMQALDDPREEFAFDLLPFTGGTRIPSDFYAAPGAPVKLGSYLEQLFLIAEVRLRTSDTPGAEEALLEAVTLSMNDISAGEITQEEVDTYISANASLSGNFEADLETIIREKYIALFTTPEPWTDFRRTGYPELEPNEGGVSGSNPNGEIPRRLIYPQSERLRNQNFPSVNPNMQDRFWWDE